MLGAGSRLPGLDSIAAFASEGRVLLAFFKVSCPTCQLAAPFLSRLSEGSLRVVGVSQDSAQLTELFNQRFGVTFETVLDDAGYAMSNAFGITNVPSLFLLDGGVIAWASDGFAKTEFAALGSVAGVEVFRGEKVPDFKPG